MQERILKTDIMEIHRKGGGEMKTKKHNWKRWIPLYLMMAPGLIYIFINNYIPMFGTIIAFKHINYQKGILGSDW